MENSLVVKSNYMIEASYRLTTQEQRLILMLSSKVRSTDQDFKEYKMEILEFQKLLGIENDADYSRIKELTKGLLSRVLVIKDPVAKTTTQMHWLDLARYYDGKGFVELKFDPVLKPFFLNLKESFTQYQLKTAIRLRSFYSIRLYELLKQYEKIGERNFGLDELKRYLGINQGEYKLYADFKKRLLVNSQKEINKKTDIRINFKEKKTGKKVTELFFLIKRHELEDSPDLDSRGKELLERLTKYFLLTAEQSLDIIKKYNYDNIEKNLEYVEDKKKKGVISDIGAYTLKAITENYYKQISLFDLEDEAIQRKTKEKEKAEQRQTEYTSYIRNEVKKIREALEEADLKEIEAQVVTQIGPKKQKIGYDKLLQVKMDEIIKNNNMLPSFEDWASQSPAF